MGNIGDKLAELKTTMVEIKTEMDNFIKRLAK